jgi:hypothetical protein
LPFYSPFQHFQMCSVQSTIMADQRGLPPVPGTYYQHTQQNSTTKNTFFFDLVYQARKSTCHLGWF